MRKTLLSLLFLVLILSCSVNVVYAPEDVDLTEFDDRLGEALGVGAFGGGLILTFVILFFFLGMLGLVMKRSPSGFMVMFLGFVILSACIAFSWFPVWPLIVITFFIALLFADRVVKRFK